MGICKTMKRIMFLIIAAVIAFGAASSFGFIETEVDAVATSYNVQSYTGPYSSVNGSYAGVDDLGRYLTLDYQTTAVNSSRYVGIFYFLWQGEHGTSGPYDNTKIVANNPSAINSESAWLAAGGGAQGAHHFWGEPLFGYYTSSDEWVMRKHVQMLTDADVDFICFDATNAYTYADRVKQVIKVWYEYYQKGYDVPKLVFYTNTDSGNVMNSIYNNIYNSSSLKSLYPNLSDLWFKWDGKPLIIGNSSDANLSSACKSYFRIKANQWPNAARKADGFPWMEFSRLLTTSSVYGLNGRKEVMNVSIAQHNATVRFSQTAWYGGNDRTRSYHNGANDASLGAYLYGHNFAEQWKYAITQGPEMVFVTGWNEWVAQRQPVISGQPIVFVDCANFNTSRDCEPMRGYYGDNYYIQLIDYIRKYKGTLSRVNPGNNTTINMTGAFSQWDSSAITAKYTDYSNDIVDRNTTGFGGIKYTNYTGRNDFVSLKATKDANYIYFYAETANNISSYTDSNWMTLFLSIGNNDNPNWYGYNYAVNLVKPASGTQAYLSQCQGGWSWSTVGTVTMKIEGKKLMLAIPRSAIGATASLFNIEFKWADNYDSNDIWSFYEDGDAAPYGRLNYLFSNSKKVATSGSDTSNPIARNMTISQTETTYTVRLNVADNASVSAVYLPTWTKSDQSDMKWVSCTISNSSTGKVATGTIKKSDFNNSSGPYTTHVYVDDSSGNRSLVAQRTYNLEPINPPTVSNISISNVTATGYTVSCTVSSNAGISKVEFPTWTVAGGQDDLKWLEGTVIGSTASVRVRISDFANSSGAYVTHVYATNSLGTRGSGVAAPTTTVPALSYPSDYIPIIGINESQWTDTATVWNSSAGSTFSAVWWTVLKAAKQSNGTYKVTEVSLSNTGTKALTASGTDILIAVKAEFDGFETASNIKVGDILTPYGLDLDNGIVAANAHFTVPAQFELKDTSVYTLSANNLTLNATGQKISNVISQFKCDVVIVNAAGTSLTSADFAGTGCVVKRLGSSGQVLNQVTIVSPGDVDGDGIIATSDYIKEKRHLKGVAPLVNSYLLAGDIDRDGTVSSTDFIRIKAICKGN